MFYFLVSHHLYFYPEAAEIVVSTVRDIDGTGSVNDTADSTSLISNNSVANDRDSLKDDDKTIGGIPAKDGKINGMSLESLTSFFGFWSVLRITLLHARLNKFAVEEKIL